MIDRLHDMLPQLEQLPLETQEEIAGYIEALIEELDRKRAAHGRGQRAKMRPPEGWVDPVGMCSDLPETMLEDLDRQRHASPPTAPIELP